MAQEYHQTEITCKAQTKSYDYLNIFVQNLFGITRLSITGSTSNSDTSPPSISSGLPDSLLVPHYTPGRRERHCESKVTYPRTQHNDSRRGPNPGSRVRQGVRVNKVFVNPKLVLFAVVISASRGDNRCVTV